MDNELKSFGFIVEFYGDKSVGIFNQQWVINGEFEFQSAEDFKAFKQKIIEAFEYCSDTPIGVVSLEEHKAKIEAGF